jgi:ribulose-5-phosphate 4-epimerase/fuculose-1-phosphate aldolase
MKSIRDLVPAEYLDFLEEVGGDFGLTQGLGGNCSYKNGDRMLVKASGMRLDDVTSSRYFYEVGLDEGGYCELEDSQKGKPSIEVSLHALLPAKFVLHLHSTKAVALSMILDQSEPERAIISEAGAALVPYCRPGVELRNAINVSYESTKASVFLLQNHGVIYSADSVQDLRGLVHNFELLWGSLLNPKEPRQFTPTTFNATLTLPESQLVQWHARNNWRLSPDHTVFLGSEPQPWLRALANREIAMIMSRLKGANTPLGVKEEQLLWFINVVLNLPKRKLSTLPLQEAEELRNWDLEKHRTAQVRNK